MLNVPPPIWALAYLLVAAGLSYLAGWPLVPGLPIIPLGIAVIVLGIALSVSSALLFRREGTELNPTSTVNRKLVTSGPFRLTRNPMYLGLVIVTFGIALWAGAWPMFLAPVATFATVNVWQTDFGDKKMRNQFGEAFDAYVRRVRRWI